MRRATLILGFLVFTGCTHCVHCPPPVTPVAPTDTNCVGACAHLQVLGCPEGDPLEDGTTCIEFCEQTQAAGHALRPSCIMTIKSCDPAEMEKCQGPREIFDD